jgi:hypothetical protein
LPSSIEEPILRFRFRDLTAKIPTEASKPKIIPMAKSQRVGDIYGHPTGGKLQKRQPPPAPALLTYMATVWELETGGEPTTVAVKLTA